MADYAAGDAQGRKVMTAMSGGVDSSAAVLLLKSRNYEVGGMTMRLLEDGLNDRDIEDAAAVAAMFDVPFFIADIRREFRERVIDDFIKAYQAGATPNPCVVCNRYIKFSAFMKCAREYGYDRMATGHYAKVEYDAGSGRYLLKKAKDRKKDQSYMLYGLDQEQLAGTIFPLGDMTKTEVRAFAEENHIVTAHKSESQDICFVRDGDYAGLIERLTGHVFEEGDFVDESGSAVGRHKGIIRYTIGQRKGLGIAAGKPIFVYEKDAEKNIVRVGEESRLFGKTLEAHNINLIACGNLYRPIRGEVKIRYSHKVSSAMIEQTGEDTLRIEFDEPQRAITRGQSVVIYDGDTVVGGGLIV